jgi:hypothetical protein
MAEFHNVGPVTTITPGATHYWEYWFTPLNDVGAAVATPNFQQPQIRTELIVRDPGVVQYDQGEGATAIHYTARIVNIGVAPVAYNLNVGNFK